MSNLQKDLNQKHEYLCQAVKGMEMVEDEHQKMVKSKEEEMTQLQQEMAELRSQLQVSEATKHLKWVCGLVQ